MRRWPKVAEVLPILYLRGLATSDFRPALEALLGENAAGLSPTNITRLTAGWEKEYQEFRQRDLSGRECQAESLSPGLNALGACEPDPATPRGFSSAVTKSIPPRPGNYEAWLS